MLREQTAESNSLGPSWSSEGGVKRVFWWCEYAMPGALASQARRLMMYFGHLHRTDTQGDGLGALPVAP